MAGYRNYPYFFGSNEVSQSSIQSDNSVECNYRVYYLYYTTSDRRFCKNRFFSVKIWWKLRKIFSHSRVEISLSFLISSWFLMGPGLEFPNIEYTEKKDSWIQRNVFNWFHFFVSNNSLPNSIKYFLEARNACFDSKK